jgi:Rad3-related DNA helicase
LFRGVEKVVLVSATVRPKTAAMLGIDSGDMEFVEYPSTFPVERRPVIHVPSIRVTYHTEQNDELMQEWLKVIDAILEPRLELGRKGLIHAVSYARAKFLRDNSRFGYLMMVHSAWDRARVVEEFRRADGPRLLVSPSVDTGYDFAGDAARFQILCKIPFASVRDSLVKARQAKDKDYDLYSVAQTIVQACGRTTRSEQDWSESFIVDDSLAWSLPKMKARGFLPRYWLDSFKSVEDVPAPIQF